MIVSQLQIFATRLRLIQNELRNLEQDVVHTVYDSQTKYYDTLLDEDVDFIKYRTAKINENLGFIQEFLAHEAIENIEAQAIIQDIKNQVAQERVSFEKDFKESID